LTSVAAVADHEQQLAWEARQRPRAGIAAIVGAVLTLAGFIWSAAAFKDLPRSYLLTSLARAPESGPIGSQPSLRTPEFQFYDSHAFTFIGSSIVRAIAYVGFAIAVTFLAQATRARRPELPRVVVYVPLVGALLTAAGSVLGGVGTVVAVQHFLDGTRTVDAAADVASDSLLLTANLISTLAPLAIAAGLLLVSLNAMRVGLLTRFLGILGMIVAALAVILQFVFAFAVAFWLLSLGLLFLNRVPGGAPPAWRTGQAEPWPSQRELAAARREAAGAKSPPEPAPEPAAAASGRAHPASKKRKRQRR
jgi:hypothetical protein